MLFPIPLPASVRSTAAVLILSGLVGVLRAAEPPPGAIPIAIRPHDPEAIAARLPKVQHEVNIYERDAVIEVEIELPPPLIQPMAFPLDQPHAVDFDLVLEEGAHWWQAEEVHVEIDWPEGSPAAQILLIVQDWEYRWYQYLIPEPVRPGRQIMDVPLRPGRTAWEPRGHPLPWHHRALADPVRVGLRVFGPNPLDGLAPEFRAWAVRRPAREPAPRITAVRMTEPRAPVFGRFEMAFRLPDRYVNPFDPREVDVWAEITPPDGADPVRVDAFYTKDYFRQVGSTGERAVAQGAPEWKIRYAPLREGAHQVVLHVKDRHGTGRWGPAEFTATPAESPGFLRVSRRDPLHFEFDNGDYFFPIGLNIRSPYDTRHDRRFPWMQRWPEGSASYTRRFEALAEQGANFAEIWTAPWSLGLEWHPIWPGYHGIGQYNLRNAWELDRVIDDAERLGLFINLVIHNHGKFSTFSDPEWDGNPFNSELGGPFDNPNDYLFTEEGRNWFRQLMRYMVARWGYSRHVFAWEFWSELNLAGQTRAMYRDRRTVDWHRVMGRFMKEIDPNRRMVTTHYSGDYTVQNMEISRLPEIDFCAVDAYHGNPESIFIVDLIRRTAEHNNPLEKPVLITEFGGTPHGGTLEHMDEALHTGLWASTVIPVAGAPLYWWWMLVEEQNWYPYYGNIARFMDGEDRRGMESVDGIRIRDGGAAAPHFQVFAMGHESRLLGWMFDRRAFGTNARIQTYEDPSIRVPWTGEDPVHFEFWDPETGQVVARTSAELRGGTARADLPAFRRDLAFKIIPGEPEPTEDSRDARAAASR